jgi:BirA family transcriptional regulator, biotin operon repressor / biotin---[acetyl-CoA-carboxylase] ligase
MIQIGKNFIRQTSVGSTNTFAAELIQKERPEEGTVILTEFQEKGRGQRETSWESNKGENLLASFIFYPSLTVADHFLFNQCIALSVHEMIKTELKKNVMIKWPNDILVNEKKIAGILIETGISGNQFQYAIAGIGINVNQARFREYSPGATSFFLETGKLFLIKDVLNRLCICFSKWYNILNEKNFDLIRIFYLSKLYRKGELSRFEISNERIIATINGINEDGRLLLEKDDGEILKINFKEVKYIF